MNRRDQFRTSRVSFEFDGTDDEDLRPSSSMRQCQVTPPPPVARSLFSETAADNASLASAVQDGTSVRPPRSSADAERMSTGSNSSFAQSGIESSPHPTPQRERHHRLPPVSVLTSTRSALEASRNGRHPPVPVSHFRGAERYARQAVYLPSPRNAATSAQAAIVERTSSSVAVLERTCSGLQSSHSSLSQRIASLTASFHSLTSLAFGNQQGSLLPAHVACETRQYISMRFQTLISASSSSLKRTKIVVSPEMYREVHDAESTPADCSLETFKALALESSRDPSVACSTVPSLYELQFLGSRSVKRLEIHFSSFADMCHYLHVPVNLRQDAVFRARRMQHAHGATRAIQIIGGMHKLKTGEAARVYLGTSRRDAFSPVYSLEHGSFDDSPVWDNGTDWDRGVTLSQATANDSDGSQFDPVVDVNDIDAQFCLRWQRLDTRGGAISTTQSSEVVLGYVRCFVPTVILRGDQLVRTAEPILFNSEGSSHSLRMFVTTPAAVRAVSTTLTSLRDPFF